MFDVNINYYFIFSLYHFRKKYGTIFAEERRILQMELESFFPIWDKIEPEQQEKLRKSAVRQIIKKGSILCDGGKECTGLVLVCNGLLRAYMLSEDGREVTVYRLFNRDICLLCASCVMTNIQFDIIIEA